MAVIGYIGLPRGGKTTSAVQDTILRELHSFKPRKIHTNIPLDLSRMALIHNVDTSYITLWDGLEGRPDSLAFANTFAAVPEEVLSSGQDHPGSSHDGCLIVYDEIHLQFMIGLKLDHPLRRGMATFVSMHGHYGIDFYWISQAYESVDVEIRRRTQHYYFVESLEKRLGGKGKFHRQLLGKDPVTHDPNFKFPYKDETISIDRSIYACFKSFEIEGSGNTQASGFILPTFVKKYGIIFIILLILVMVFTGLAIKRLMNAANVFGVHQPSKSAVDSAQAKGLNSAKKEDPSISIDGSLCVGESCDLYRDGVWLGTFDVKDTAVKARIKRDLDNKSTGN